MGQERVHITPETGGTPESRDIVAGRGLEGDRYFTGDGLSNERAEPEPSDVTLIEMDALEAAAEDYDVDFDPGAHRRNVTTRGVALNHLVGERFRVGGSVLEGTVCVSRAGTCSRCRRTRRGGGARTPWRAQRPHRRIGTDRRRGRRRLVNSPSGNPPRPAEW